VGTRDVREEVANDEAVEVATIGRRKTTPAVATISTAQSNRDARETSMRITDCYFMQTKL
jgi:hypothetical protein